MTELHTELYGPQQAQSSTIDHIITTRFTMSALKIAGSSHFHLITENIVTETCVQSQLHVQKASSFRLARCLILMASISQWTGLKLLILRYTLESCSLQISLAVQGPHIRYITLPRGLTYISSSSRSCWIRDLAYNDAYLRRRW
jgi:hypothetical protein